MKANRCKDDDTFTQIEENWKCKEKKTRSNTKVILTKTWRYGNHQNTLGEEKFLSRGYFLEKKFKV